MFAPNPDRSLAQTLVLGAVIAGVMMLCAVIVSAITSWLLLVVHEGLH
jgi:hypothetical protein